MIGVRTTNLDMGLDLRSELLEVLDDRAIDGTPEISVLISNDSSLVADAIVDVLKRRVRPYNQAPTNNSPEDHPPRGTDSRI